MNQNGKAPNRNRVLGEDLAAFLLKWGITRLQFHTKPEVLEEFADDLKKIGVRQGDFEGEMAAQAVATAFYCETLNETSDPKATVSLIDYVVKAAEEDEILQKVKTHTNTKFFKWREAVWYLRDASNSLYLAIHGALCNACQRCKAILGING